MPKRGENIYKRKDGRWEGRIREQIGIGRYGYRSVYGKTYKEVRDKMYRLMQKTEKKDGEDYTMAEAVQLWIKSQSPYWKAGTYSSYTRMLDKYILPYIGQIRISQITDRIMMDFMEKVNAHEPESALSGNYMFQICSMVRRIMLYMNKQYDNGIIVPKNPVASKKAGNIILPSDVSLSVLEDYLLSHSDNRTCLGILIALHTGIRIGELSALLWNDIDLDEGILYVRRNMLRVYRNKQSEEDEGRTQVVKQNPKSSDSLRIIPLPPRLIPILRQHQRIGTDYVVNGVKLPWAEPRTIQYRFEGILQECQIEHFNFHMLRHVFATRCVAIGLDVKSLSEILGHSNIQMTLKLYVHSTVQQKRLLMMQYDSAVR
ncbi:MAG: site-specific integrase [Eubacterium sp.]|nr:site-specific integrase [Eubacterium sp.]